MIIFTFKPTFTCSKPTMKHHSNVRNSGELVLNTVGFEQVNVGWVSDIRKSYFSEYSKKVL